jgi:hypothetical protein
MGGEADLRRLTSAGSGPEAELVKNLLENEGIRCLIRRPAAFDVPDFLAGGPREILVDAIDLERATVIVEEHVGLH